MSSTPIKVQFFLTYGVLGSLSPIAALVLDAKGFSARQFGLTLALSSIGLLFSPTVTAWLADREVDTRVILRTIFVATAIALSGVFFSDQIWAISAFWACYSILYVPALPLLDGYYFNHEREHGAGAAGADGGYQFIRAWGTIGFLVPSVALYFIIQFTGEITNAIWLTVVWCGFCFLGTFMLKPSTVAGTSRAKSPTLRAAKVLFSREALPMCLGLFFVGIAASAYYPVLSAFLRDEVKIEEKWIAMLMSLGVLIEVGYLFGLGPLRRLLRIRGIMIVGLSCMAIRLAALAYFPTLTTSLIIQVFHGLEILAMFVVPVIYLDRVAGDGFRNSIQGAYTVVVIVPTRLLGFLIGGEIRQLYGTTAVLYSSAALVALGMLVVLFFFKPKPAPVAAP